MKVRPLIWFRTRFPEQTAEPRSNGMEVVDRMQEKGWFCSWEIVIRAVSGDAATSVARRSRSREVQESSDGV